MKKTITKGLSLFMAMLMLISCFAGFNIEAYAAEKTKKIDGVTYYYTIKSGKATITYFNSAKKKTVTLPSKLGGKAVTAVGEYAANWSEYVTTLKIPNSVKTLSSNAFWGLEKLKTVNIGKGLEKIDGDAFPCTTITKFTVDKDNKNFSTKSGSLYNKKKTKLVKFTVGKKTTSVKLDKTVTSIGIGAFRGDSYIQTISMPGVKKIGAMAFFGCTKFKTNTISSKVTSIGYYAYSGTAVTKITVPKSVTSLGYACFSNCSKLTSVDLSKTRLKSIQKETFSLSKKLSTVKLPKTVTKIGSYALCGTAITSIDFSKVTTISEGVVSECSKLTKITIPKNVTKIGAYAFSGTGIKSITIPKTVKSIGIGILYGCKKLTSVTLPSNMTKIPDEMFSHCTALETVKIPSSVTKIGNYAFYGCKKLSSITIPSKVTSIKGGAFSCSGLTSIKIPNSVTSIGEYCFEDCSKLKSVTLPNKLKTIKYACFNNAALTSVNIPASVSTIEYMAFAGCSKLKTVTINNANPNIDDLAFDNYNQNLTLRGNSVVKDYAEYIEVNYAEI